jgi:hypothetical protein
MRDQLLNMLEAEENKVIQQLSTAVKELDKTIDTRFDALAEVVDQIIDMVEELHEEEVKPEPKEDKPDPVLSDILMGVRGLRVQLQGIKLPEQEKVDISPLQKEISVLKSQMYELKQNQIIIAKSMKHLLTARRIPIFDSEGNVIAAEVETQYNKL